MAAGMNGDIAASIWRLLLYATYRRTIRHEIQCSHQYNPAERISLTLQLSMLRGLSGTTTCSKRRALALAACPRSLLPCPGCAIRLR